MVIEEHLKWVLELDRFVFLSPTVALEYLEFPGMPREAQLNLMSVFRKHGMDMAYAAGMGRHSPEQVNN
jgi:hypothetical protein